MEKTVYIAKLNGANNSSTNFKPLINIKPQKAIKSDIDYSNIYYTFNAKGEKSKKYYTKPVNVFKTLEDAENYYNTAKEKVLKDMKSKIIELNLKIDNFEKYNVFGTKGK